MVDKADKGFLEKKKKADAMGLLGSLLSRRWMFDLPRGGSPFLERHHLISEPELVDEVTINGERWEVWQGILSDGGDPAPSITYMIRIQHNPEDKESTRLLDYRGYNLHTMMKYEYWKRDLERKGDTVESYLTRFINKEEHGGILSKKGF